MNKGGKPSIFAVKKYFEALALSLNSLKAPSCVLLTEKWKPIPACILRFFGSKVASKVPGVILNNLESITSSLCFVDSPNALSKFVLMDAVCAEG